MGDEDVDGDVAGGDDPDPADPFPGQPLAVCEGVERVAVVRVGVELSLVEGEPVGPIRAVKAT